MRSGKGPPHPWCNVLLQVQEGVPVLGYAKRGDDRGKASKGWIVVWLGVRI